jgi:non-ribosomal peptide synthase protein (TIGR01720 family)
LSVSLTRQETDELLHRVPKAYDTQINDVLLAALCRAITAWTGKDAAVIDLEGHGRVPLFDEVDLSRTVGWFTSVFPVRLQLHGSDPEDLLQGAKNDLRRIPNAGIGYGLLRYLNREHCSVLRSSPEPQVLFNYFGQMEGLVGAARLLRVIPQNTGTTESPRQSRNHLLEINAMVIGGRLQADWTYSGQFHRRETIASVAERFRQELLRLISHCLLCLERPSSPKFRLKLDEASLRKITAMTENIS